MEVFLEAPIKTMGHRAQQPLASKVEAEEVNSVGKKRRRKLAWFNLQDWYSLCPASLVFLLTNL